MIDEKNNNKCTAPSKTLVRALANVNALSPNVNSSRVTSTASSPRMTVWPVMNPMVSTAGIVRLMVASTDPNKMLTEC